MTSKYNHNIPRDVRFWDCVDKKADDECWEWKAGLHKTGYACMRYKKVEEKQLSDNTKFISVEL